MTTLSECGEYADHVVARIDNGDVYDAYGWMVVVVDDAAALIRYNHCSCYGTWDGGQLDWDWEGSVTDFVEFARETRDPDMPDRCLQEGDYEASDLRILYSEFLEWAAKNGHCEASA